MLGTTLGNLCRPDHAPRTSSSVAPERGDAWVLEASRVGLSLPCRCSSSEPDLEKGTVVVEK